METAKSRKTAIEFISRNLVATARQAIVKISQTEIARKLNKPDSTIMRRTERLEDDMSILAAAGVHDLVLEGEKKIPLEQYRWLMSTAMQFAQLQLEMTKEKPQESCNSFAA